MVFLKKYNMYCQYRYYVQLFFFQYYCLLQYNMSHLHILKYILSYLCNNNFTTNAVWFDYAHHDCIVKVSLSEVEGRLFFKQCLL